jgi:hypothetical protein
VDFVNFFKEPTLCFIDSSYSLFGFDLIDLGPHLHYFSPSAGVGFGLFLFS